MKVRGAFNWCRKSMEMAVKCKYERRHSWCRKRTEMGTKYKYRVGLEKVSLEKNLVGVEKVWKWEVGMISIVED